MQIFVTSTLDFRSFEVQTNISSLSWTIFKTLAETESAYALSKTAGTVVELRIYYWAVQLFTADCWIFTAKASAEQRSTFERIYLTDPIMWFSKFFVILKNSLIWVPTASSLGRDSIQTNIYPDRQIAGQTELRNYYLDWFVAPYLKDLVCIWRERIFR